MSFQTVDVHMHSPTHDRDSFQSLPEVVTPNPTNSIVVSSWEWFNFIQQLDCAFNWAQGHLYFITISGEPPQLQYPECRQECSRKLAAIILRHRNLLELYVRTSGLCDPQILNALCSCQVSSLRRLKLNLCGVTFSQSSFQHSGYPEPQLNIGRLTSLTILASGNVTIPQYYATYISRLIDSSVLTLQSICLVNESDRPIQLFDQLCFRKTSVADLVIAFRGSYAAHLRRHETTRLLASFTKLEDLHVKGFGQTIDFDCLEQCVVGQIPGLQRLYISVERAPSMVCQDLCSPESPEVEVLDSWTKDGSNLELLKFERFDPDQRLERACLWRSIPGPISRCWQHFWACPEGPVFT